MPYTGSAHSNTGDPSESESDHISLRCDDLEEESKFEIRIDGTPWKAASAKAISSLANALGKLSFKKVMSEGIKSHNTGPLSLEN